MNEWDVLELVPRSIEVRGRKDKDHKVERNTLSLLLFVNIPLESNPLKNLNAESLEKVVIDSTLANGKIIL